MIKLIAHSKLDEEIRMDDDEKYIFDFENNFPGDIIKIQSPQLYNSVNNGNYWFGYKFNEETSSSQREDFIKYIKGLSEKRILDSELERIIELPLEELDKHINIYAMDGFVFPLSERSPLVSRMVQTINNYMPRNVGRLSFELVKSLPADVYFDYDMLKSDIGHDVNRYNQIVRYVDDVIIPSINKEGYFSLAERVKKSKYRKYITNYLSFSEEDMQNFSKLEGSNILVVDDINTSGSTLHEVLRTIRMINRNCNIYIYTLIGK